MSIENTDLERRVLAHEQILQALLAQLERNEPGFLDAMQARFTGVRSGAHQHDYIETADYAEAFLVEVGRLAGRREAAVPPPVAPPSVAPPRLPPEPGAEERIVIRSERRGGIWHVTRDRVFVGDYVSEEAAKRAVQDVAREIERRGGQSDIAAGPAWGF